MANFNHFLITRFNIKSDTGFDGVITTRTFEDLEWLKDRFKRFEEYCYLSVKSQTNSNFKWLVLFDIDTPESFRERINSYKSYPNFIPIFINNFNKLKLQEIIINNLTDAPKYLITTRLDNDDAISQNYIEMIQDNFNYQSFEIINFHLGYVWDESSGRLYLNGRGCNPFLSLIESIEDFKTIFLPEHHYQLYDKYQPKGMLKNIILETQPAWFQVIHGKNISNHREGIRIPLKNLSKNFIIQNDKLHRPENLFFVWLEQRMQYFNRLPWVKLVRTKIALRTRLRGLFGK